MITNTQQAASYKRKPLKREGAFALIPKLIDEFTDADDPQESDKETILTDNWKPSKETREVEDIVDVQLTPKVNRLKIVKVKVRDSSLVTKPGKQSTNMFVRSRFHQ